MIFIRLSRTYEELKHYLRLIFLCLIWCLSRTYEELKQKYIYISRKIFLTRLSRTYEELKLYFLKPSPSHSSQFIAYLWGIETPYNNSNNNSKNYRLSRTYEELKRSNLFYNRQLNNLVYRVPMRNWNYIWIAFFRSRYSVYRVPMRNWNCYFWWYLKRDLLWFIAYLWGIETWYWKRFFLLPVHVYRVPMRNWN